MLVTDMPVDRLIPYARNPRNNTAAIDAVKASIAEFGFRHPDPPPLNWSTLKYVFWQTGGPNGQQATQARRDRNEAPSG